MMTGHWNRVWGLALLTLTACGNSLTGAYLDGDGSTGPVTMWRFRGDGTVDRTRDALGKKVTTRLAYELDGDRLVVSGGAEGDVVYRVESDSRISGGGITYRRASAETQKELADQVVSVMAGVWDHLQSISQPEHIDATLAAATEALADELSWVFASTFALYDKSQADQAIWQRMEERLEYQWAKVDLDISEDIFDRALSEGSIPRDVLARFEHAVARIDASMSLPLRTNWAVLEMEAIQDSARSAR